MQDIRFAVRGILRAPGLSLGIIVVLAAGTGATSAMVSVLDALVYRPLGVADPHTLIAVETLDAEGRRRLTPYAALEFLHSAHLPVDGWCGYSGGALDPTDGGETPMSAWVEFVTGDCLRIFGVAPALGRWIGENDAPIPGKGALVAVDGERFSDRCRFDRIGDSGHESPREARPVSCPRNRPRSG